MGTQNINLKTRNLRLPLVIMFLPFGPKILIDSENWLLSYASSCDTHPGDPKLTMTSQFPQKSYHRFFPYSRLQNKGEEKKENELVFFRKLTLLKSKINHCFLLLSPLEPPMQNNLDVNFLGKLWHHKQFWITLIEGVWDWHHYYDNQFFKHLL